MAKLAEYGEINYDEIFHYEIYVETIDTLLGLLAFPIVEETIDDEGITISVFEKSFWSKKPKGYISLKYIEDIQLDTTINNFEDSIAEIAKFNEEYYLEDEPIHEFSNLLLGLDFYSAYSESPEKSARK